MSSVTSALPDDARKATGDALQGGLVDLIDLSLQAKQAHWNIRGRNFRSVHLLLDEVVDLARAHMDTIAERAVAIGVNPDGRPTTVAEAAQGPRIEPGYIQDDKVIAAFTDILLDTVRRFRERVDVTDTSDPVTQDMLITVTQDLEKQHWMFEVQR